MKNLKGIVGQLRIEDDLKCVAIGEIAIKCDISYKDAEKIVDAKIKRAERLLKEVALC